MTITTNLLARGYGLIANHPKIAIVFACPVAAVALSLITKTYRKYSPSSQESALALGFEEHHAALSTAFTKMISHLTSRDFEQYALLFKVLTQENLKYGLELHQNKLSDLKIDIRDMKFKIRLTENGIKFLKESIIPEIDLVPSKPPGSNLTKEEKDVEKYKKITEKNREEIKQFEENLSLQQKLLTKLQKERAFLEENCESLYQGRCKIS